VDQVRREVAWGLTNSSYSIGALTALSAMNYTVGHVSVGAYGYLLMMGLPLPGPAGNPTPNSILGLQAGICGHAALTFAAIVKHFGYPVRSVQFWYTYPDGVTPDSHIAAEVFYDGAWHFFDPTFGVFWTDIGGNVESIDDVRTNGGTRVADTASFTNLIEDPAWGGDASAFVTDPLTRVVIDGQPFNY
jgi:transglutaminase superfamily protein